MAKASFDIETLKQIPVKSALLHQAISGGPAMPTEKSLNSTKLPGVKLWLSDQGLLVDYKKVIMIVPLANVAGAVVSDGK